MKSLSLSLLFILLLQLSHIIFAKRNGLTIKLIHRDSKESPLYPGNLTHEERVERFHHQSKAYAKRMFSLMKARNGTMAMHPDEVRASMYFDGSFYMVSVGIGTFNQVPWYKRYFLMVDTGSEHVWTQCQGCNPCFAQTEPVYPYPQSSTFHPILCQEHDFCGEPGHCMNNVCTYEAEYGGGASTGGFLAAEKFTFQSDGPASEIVDNLIIGCGLSQNQFSFGQDGPQNSIAGILGMGYSSFFSFIAQLGNRAQNKFSHCLPPWRNGGVSITFLRFGDDAYFHSSERVLNTGLFNVDEVPYYYVQLFDITIGETRLNFPPGSLTLQRDDTGGCIFDTGAPWTVMSARHYARVTSVLDSLLQGLKKESFGDFQHCYKKGHDMPSMTFHFTRADYEVSSEQLFIEFQDRVCLAIKIDQTNRLPLIIGNHMLANYRFIYDLTSHRLSFAREDCSTNQ